MTDLAPVLKAFKRFAADAADDGERVRASPLSDPTLRVERISQEGEHVLLSGVDEEGQDVLLVMPAAQLALRMVAEPGDPGRGSFGFIEKDEP
ncbi:hypothetical protein [Methylobacterium sp. WSM2598]|uniref:hypothetical protein n=1 Tax=Methylobacterium sp. WSM2598 TaxID=398261 RepID=UPI00037B88AC|nr:hypothetical protein [Methylobacterium sp. WSM2598]